MDCSTNLCCLLNSVCIFQVHYKAPDGKSTLWDEIEKPISNKPTVNVKPKQVPSCKKQTLYTVREGKIVCLGSKFKEEPKQLERKVEYKPSGQAFVALKAPCENQTVLERLSEDEIRLLPKLENYERGIVSNVRLFRFLMS